MNLPAAAPWAMVLLYSVLAFVAGMAGVALLAVLQLTHTRLQLAVSFVGGLMLTLALTGLLPHACHQLPSLHQATGWLLAGFLVMFLLQRFLPFHHCDVDEGSPVEKCGHTHSLAERSARRLGWLGVTLGLSLHSVFDGLAMAAAVVADSHSHSGALGLGTALAVILHKPFGALAISTLMVVAGTRKSSQWLVSAGFALVTPLGCLLFYAGAGPLVDSHPALLGAALAFCAGTFLCIAGADLLPEVQFHSHDRGKLTVALVAGVVVALAIARFSHPGHNHPGHDAAPAAPGHEAAAVGIQ